MTRSKTHSWQGSVVVHMDATRAQTLSTVYGHIDQSKPPQSSPRFCRAELLVLQLGWESLWFGMQKGLNCKYVPRCFLKTHHQVFAKYLRIRSVSLAFKDLHLAKSSWTAQDRLPWHKMTIMLRTPNRHSHSFSSTKWPTTEPIVIYKEKKTNNAWVAKDFWGWLLCSIDCCYFLFNPSSLSQPSPQALCVPGTVACWSFHLMAGTSTLETGHSKLGLRPSMKLPVSCI